MAATYRVRELFITLQGEGVRAGSKALFLRLAGCNLWNGLPSGRAAGKGACARWCDTDFAKGDKVDLGVLLTEMHHQWPWEHGTPKDPDRWVVITGGEPMLQVDADLVQSLHHDGWKIAVETNGTVDVSIMDELDWLCVSPKKGGEIKRTRGHELKVVLPGAVAGEEGWTPEELEELGKMDFDHRFVQPQDPIHVGQIGDSYLHPISPHGYLAKTYSEHLQRCIAWVQERPAWRLSPQMHKFCRLP